MMKKQGRRRSSIATASNPIPDPGASCLIDDFGGLYLPFDQIYALGDVINDGAFGIVHRAHHVKHPERTLAIKVVDKICVDDERIARHEAKMLRDFRHVPNVIELVDFYADIEKMYIVQALAEGGDLFDRIVEKQIYTELDAKTLIRNLLETVLGLHSQRVVHRDLKPENILLRSADTDTDILLCDFGDAKVLPDDGSVLRTCCGTPAFTAPEIVEGEGYGMEVDLWSVGCITFMLLEGFAPFGDEEDAAILYDRTSTADFNFDNEVWTGISAHAKKFIQSVIKVNPKDRLKARDALNCPWFDRSSPTSSSSSNSDVIEISRARGKVPKREKTRDATRTRTRTRIRTRSRSSHMGPNKNPVSVPSQNQSKQQDSNIKDEEQAMLSSNFGARAAIFSVSSNNKNDRKQNFNSDVCGKPCTGNITTTYTSGQLDTENGKPDIKPANGYLKTMKAPVSLPRKIVPSGTSNNVLMKTKLFDNARSNVRADSRESASSVEDKDMDDVVKKTVSKITKISSENRVIRESKAYPESGPTKESNVFKLSRKLAESQSNKGPIDSSKTIDGNKQVKTLTTANSSQTSKVLKNKMLFENDSAPVEANKSLSDQDDVLLQKIGSSKPWRKPPTPITSDTPWRKTEFLNKKNPSEPSKTWKKSPAPSKNLEKDVSEAEESKVKYVKKTWLKSKGDTYGWRKLKNVVNNKNLTTQKFIPEIDDEEATVEMTDSNRSVIPDSTGPVSDDEDLTYILNGASSSSSSPPPSKTTLVGSKNLSTTRGECYTLQEIQSKSIPELDYKVAETYLSDEDFYKIFKASREEVAKWKPWKIVQHKVKGKIW